MILHKYKDKDGNYCFGIKSKTGETIAISPECYQDEDGNYRFQMKSKTGEIITTFPESYQDGDDCTSAIKDPIELETFMKQTSELKRLIEKGEC